MARRKNPLSEAAEDSPPPAAPRLPVVLWVGDQLVGVTPRAPPARLAHPGACTCDACGASRLADLAIRFY
jgi:hypothetical protein